MAKQIYIDVKYINATEWQPLNYFSTGGTRAKIVLEDSKGKRFFFKESERKEAKGNKPAKYYQYEFFNEIIAYQLGKQLGLDMLRYDVALYNNTLGCISPNMHNLDKEEELVEFSKYMIALNPSFDPNTYEARKEYTFQLLEYAFQFFEHNEKYIQFVFKVLLFDSIIGNVDRHQENWAFITLAPKTLVEQSANHFNKMVKDNNVKKLIGNLIKLFSKIKTQKQLLQVAELTKLYVVKVKTTAPIYDSGSSLARELTEEKVEVLLANEEALKKYILQGKAELHWHHEKKTHFDLLDCLLDTEWKTELLHEAQFIEKYKEGMMEKIINKINKQLPQQWEHYKIPESRKRLLAKIVSLRIQELKKRFNARV